MRTATSTISTADKTGIGTFHQFIAARVPALVNPEQGEAFGREAYYIVAQIVQRDRGFSQEAIQSLPAIKRNKFTLLNIFKWILLMQLWWENLTDFEQTAFSHTEVTWK